MLVQKQHKSEESTFPWWSDGIRWQRRWWCSSPGWPSTRCSGQGGSGQVGTSWTQRLSDLAVMVPVVVVMVIMMRNLFLLEFAHFLCWEKNCADGGKNSFLLQWKEINQENQGKYNQFPTNHSFLKEFSHLLWPHLQPLIDGSPQLQHESWITFCDYPKRLH